MVATYGRFDCIWDKLPNDKNIVNLSKINYNKNNLLLFSRGDSNFKMIKVDNGQIKSINLFLTVTLTREKILSFDDALKRHTATDRAFE